MSYSGRCGPPLLPAPSGIHVGVGKTAFSSTGAKPIPRAADALEKYPKRAQAFGRDDDYGEAQSSSQLQVKPSNLGFDHQSVPDVPVSRTEREVIPRNDIIHKYQETTKNNKGTWGEYETEGTGVHGKSKGWEGDGPDEAAEVSRASAYRGV